MLLIMRGFVRTNPDKRGRCTTYRAEERRETRFLRSRGARLTSPVLLGSRGPFARQNESHLCACEGRASQQNVNDTSRQFSHPRKSLWLFVHWCNLAPRG